MGIDGRLKSVYNNAFKIEIDNSSKLVFISDCHRGDGSNADNFDKNKNIYFAAISHYNREKFTYIELGDGDELWQNRDIEQIIKTHGDVFWRLRQFYDDDRLYMLYGNHDMEKRKNSDNFSQYYDDNKQGFLPLFPKLEVYEGIVLTKKESGNQILLLHGHQADFLNYNLWRLSRFLVRYIWTPLELVGIKDPTSAWKNDKTRNKIEMALFNFTQENNIAVIAGHTHSPVMYKVGEGKYFNDGCCVHSGYINAIEIENGKISLVKWRTFTRTNGNLYVGKTVIIGENAIDDYF